MQENESHVVKEQQKSETQAFDFSAEFDSLINANGKITPSLLTAVNRYFLYFSFFESLLLDCSGGQGKSNAYAKALTERNLVDNSVVNEAFSIFSKRYTEDRAKFESLCGDEAHTKPSVREHYHSIMMSGTDEPLSQIDLCLFVCFRLRNNLFHGPKWKYYLEGQESLLLTAGNLIHSVLSRVDTRDGWKFVNILTPIE